MEAIVTTPTSVVCPYCGARSPAAHFCSECGKIQPVPAGQNYFAFFDLSRKLTLDASALEKTFYALSRQFHPDYFMNSSPAEQEASTDRSSMLNEAYRNLRDPIRRTQYLLLLEGYKEAEKKAPPDFLEEVFDLNMQIEELKAAKKMQDEDEFAAARASLEEAEKGLRERLAAIDGDILAGFQEWDQAYEVDDTVRKKGVLD